MAGDATTMPLHGGPLRSAVDARAGSESSVRLRTRAGTAAVGTILAGSLFLVLAAANRPSWLASTTHSRFFPHWLAGPLGGLWPGMTYSATTLKYWVTGAIVVMYLGYILLLRCVPALSARLIVVAIVAVHLIFVLSPPLTLTDVFNYINYGRMEIVHHLNPYTTIPILEPHGDPSYPLSNWHELRSPYGPLFTLLTFAVVPLGVAGSFWALKILLAAASLTTILLTWKCARLLNRDPVAAVAMVGLNPIILVWGLGGDHNDSLMVLCIMLGLYLLLRSRSHGGDATAAPKSLAAWLVPLVPLELGAGAAFVAATAIKASAAVLIPLALLSLRRRPRTAVQMVLGMIAAGILMGVASVLAFGLHLPDLSTQSQVVANESVPNLIGLAAGLGGETAALRAVMTAALALTMLACWRLAWRRSDPITAAGWASVALLFALSWVLPWYVLWALPLAALSSSRRLRATVLLAGAYLIVAWAPASSQLWNAIDFHPESTSVGRLHQRYIKELLN